MTGTRSETREHPAQPTIRSGSPDLIRLLPGFPRTRRNEHLTDLPRGHYRNPAPAGTRREGAVCIVCQVLEQDPEEPQLHRLVRHYALHLQNAEQALVDDLEVALLRRQVREQAEEIDHLKLIISNHRRPK